MPFQRFEEKIRKLSFGRMTYHVIFLPQKVLVAFNATQGQRMRVAGSIDGVGVNLGFNTGGADGKVYLIVGKALLLALNKKAGDTVLLELSRADSNAVDVPEELSSALQANKAAAKVWDDLTPGKRRGLCALVASAKLAETRVRRATELCGKLAVGEVPGPPSLRR